MQISLNHMLRAFICIFFFFQAEDGIRDLTVTGVQTCALPISLHAPAVLFLDEPTSGVDPLMRREFWHHINALTAKGVAVVVTTHFMEEAEYCDRIGLIWRGRKIAEGTPDELKASVRSPARPEPTLEDAFIALIEGEAA